MYRKKAGKKIKITVHAAASAVFVHHNYLRCNLDNTSHESGNRKHIFCFFVDK